MPALLDMVDAGKIGFSIAADYLYKLFRQEQAWLLDSIAKYQATRMQRYFSLLSLTMTPGRIGRAMGIASYRLAQRIFHIVPVIHHVNKATYQSGMV